MQKVSSIRPVKHISGLLLAVSLLAFTQAVATPLEQARKDELKNILLQDCGSCHGITLKGGLGPALTTDALQGKPENYLQQTILEGHPGTPMPPWKDILSVPDINYLVSLLKAGIAE